MEERIMSFPVKRFAKILIEIEPVDLYLRASHPCAALLGLATDYQGEHFTAEVLDARLTKDNGWEIFLRGALKTATGDSATLADGSVFDVSGWYQERHDPSV